MHAPQRNEVVDRRHCPNTSFAQIPDSIVVLLEFLSEVQQIESAAALVEIHFLVSCHKSDDIIVRIVGQVLDSAFLLIDAQLSGLDAAHLMHVSVHQLRVAAVFLQHEEAIVSPRRLDLLDVISQGYLILKVGNLKLLGFFRSCLLEDISLSVLVCSDVV